MSLPLPTRLNGQVIDQTWFNAINAELVALDNLVTAIKTNNSIPFEVYGDVFDLINEEGVLTYKVVQPIILQGALLTQILAGSAGDLEVDVQLSQDNGATWNSIFNQTPMVNYQDLDYATDLDANGQPAILNSLMVNLVADDLLRMDVVSGQEDAKDFILSLRYKPTGT